MDVPASRSRDTRRALLDQATLALRELTPAALLSAVGAKEIARRAGVGVTTLYHHFGTLEQFAEAVVASVYDPDRFPVTSVTSQVDNIRGAGVPVVAAREMHRHDFHRLDTDPEFRVRLGLWALGGSALDQPYGDLLRAIDRRIATALEPMIRGWGRELRPPIDPAAFIAAHTALVSGAVVRHKVDPQAFDVEKFAGIAQGVTLVTLRPVGDRHTLDDRLAEINYYALDRASPISPGRAADVRSSVVTAARQLLQRNGVSGTSPDQVARLAGVSRSALYKVFSGVDDIALHVVLDDATHATADLTHDPLLALAQFIGQRAAFVRPYVVWIATVPSTAHDPWLTLLTSWLLDSGGVSEEGPAVHLARSLLLAVASHLLHEPAGGPTAAAEHARGLIGPSTGPPAPGP